MMFMAIWTMSEWMPIKWCLPTIDIVDIGIHAVFDPNDYELLGHGWIRRYLYLRRSLVPTEVRNKHMRGFKGFLAFLSGNTCIPFEYHEQDAIQIPDKDCKNPSGTILILGRGFNRQPIPSVSGSAKEENKILYKKLLMMQDNVSQLEIISSQLAASNNKNLLDAAQKLRTITKDLSEGFSDSLTVKKALIQDQLTNRRGLEP